MKKFSLLLGLSAILISAIAGFFSITGIAMLFVGHFIPVIIMGGALEFAKLIIASFLYRYWDDVAKSIRYYLLAGMLILMLITSGGIFGFLSDAYNKSSGTVKIVDKELVLMQKQKETKVTEIERYQNRITQLSDIREQQERRTDSLYSKGWTTSAKAVTNAVKATTADIEQYNSKIGSLQKDISALDSGLISKETQVLSSDVGPLRYMANIFNTDMDTVVKWFILLLIFVFDPIAVTLIVAFNITLFKDGRKTFGLSKKDKPIMEIPKGVFPFGEFEKEKPKIPIEPPKIETVEQIKEIHQPEIVAQPTQAAPPHTELPAANWHQ